VECLSGWLEIPPTPSLEVRRFGHGERRREAREKVAVVLAIGHVLRAHEACVPLLAVVVIKKGSQIFEYGGRSCVVWTGAIGFADFDCIGFSGSQLMS
jgi:hypothetical protein